MDAHCAKNFVRGAWPACRRQRLARALCAAALALSLPLAAPAYDLHFDYTSFETSFGQAQFNVLNYPSINGNYMMTSTDNHRPEMVANGNDLAQFYNNFLVDYNTQFRANAINAAAEADAINQYVIQRSTNNGPRPDWLILNEISASLWPPNAGPPENSTYRSWVVDCVTRLHEHYGYNVVTFSPFQNPGANDASWQALAEVSYIGIECYLSGTEVWNSGSDYASRLAWAQGQYQASKNSYLNRGVPEEKLFLGEHFANNAATFTDSQGNVRSTGWGRAGLASAAAWDSVIQIRQDAILNVGFEGFLAYNWGGNGLGVTQAEQIQHEYYYRSRRVLPTQRPQWLSDAAINVNGTIIPLSWSQPLNWLGGVPDAIGAEANFWRTLSAARTITLDGSRTVGVLTFDSPVSYTISPGTGGGLALNRSGGPAMLISNQGNHTIAAGVQLAGDVSAAINAGTFTISGGVSGAGALTKSGPGTLALTAANSYAGATTIAAGRLRVGTTLNTPGGGITIQPGGVLEASGLIQRPIANNGLVDGPAAPAALNLAGPVSGAGSLTGNIWLLNTFSPGEVAAATGHATVSFERVNLGAQATLAIDLGGSVPGLQHDAIAVSGAAALAGALEVTLTGGFTPSVGQSFTILTAGNVAGMFSTELLPAVPHLEFDVVYNPTSVVLTVAASQAGDYDIDGDVDGGDLLAWQRGLGSTTDARADGNRDGVVDAADLMVWQENFGAVAAPSAGEMAVPEPALFSLLAAGLAARRLMRKRRSKVYSHERPGIRIRTPVSD